MSQTNKADLFLDKGVSLIAAGKIDDAISSFLKVIKLNPKSSAALFNLGLAYGMKGENKEAVKTLEKVVEINPKDAQAYNYLGHYQTLSGMVDNALESFKKASILNPKMAEAYYNLGVCYMNKGNYSFALRHYQKSLLLMPNHSMVLNNIGYTYGKMGENDQALKYYHLALKKDPNNAFTMTNLGTQLITSDTNKAADYFKRALAVAPNTENTAYFLGISESLLGHPNESIAAFERSLILDPQHPPTYGQLYLELRRSCEWKKIKKMEKITRLETDYSLKGKKEPAETPFISLVHYEDPRRNSEIAKGWSKYLISEVGSYHHVFSFAKRSKQNPKIRIGYLSAGTDLIKSLFKHHDQTKFELKAYVYGNNSRNNDNYSDISNLSDKKAAVLIYQDKIDILVDLIGFNPEGRIKIAAQKPAPIQIAYPGFPGSTGKNIFHYLIADSTVIPEENLEHYSEKLIFLPYCYQLNNYYELSIKKDIARKVLSLPKDAFIFCNLGRPYLIDPKTFTSWMRILKSVPKSVLNLTYLHDLQIKNLSSEAKKHGVNPKRIIFTPPPIKDDRITRLSLCDLALDTFSFNCMGFTLDSLRAGLPVVTLLGKHFPSRTSASMLTTLDLPELISHSPKAYENLAISLAKEPKKLKGLSEKLKTNMLQRPLFDTQKQIAYIEDVYQQVWKIYRDNKKPKTIYIKPPAK